MVAQGLLCDGLDVNAQGGRYGNALQAASVDGHFDVVRLLVDGYANANAPGGEYGNLQDASYRGHVDIVRLLVDRGADQQPYPSRLSCDCCNEVAVATQGGMMDDETMGLFY